MIARIRTNLHRIKRKCNEVSVLHFNTLKIMHKFAQESACFSFWVSLLYLFASFYFALCHFRFFHCIFIHVTFSLLIDLISFYVCMCGVRVGLCIGETKYKNLKYKRFLFSSVLLLISSVFQTIHNISPYD